MKKFADYFFEQSKEEHMVYISPYLRYDKKMKRHERKVGYDWVDWDEDDEPKPKLNMTSKQGNYLAGLYPGASYDEETKTLVLGDYMRKVLAYFGYKTVDLKIASHLIELALMVKNSLEKNLKNVNIDDLFEFLSINKIKSFNSVNKNYKLIDKNLYDEIVNTVFAPYIKGEDKLDGANDFQWRVIVKPFFGYDYNKDEREILKTLEAGMIDKGQALNFLEKHREKLKKFDAQYKQEGKGGIATKEQKRNLVEKYGTDRKKWNDDVIENINFISKKDAEELLSTKQNLDDATPAQIKLITQMYGKYDRFTPYGKFKENIMAEVESGMTKSRANELIKNKEKYKARFENAK